MTNDRVTIDGESAEGYGVTFSPSVLRSEMDNANLPAWMKQALAHVTVGRIHVGGIDHRGRVEVEPVKAETINQRLEEGAVFTPRHGNVVELALVEIAPAHPRQHAAGGEVGHDG